jgi:integrase/recombinase XerD
MSSLREDLDNYLQLRRHLGHDLADAARLLPRFVDYLEKSGQTTVTVSHALAWSMQPDVRPGSSVRPRRMTAARGFARYLSGIDPATEVPPRGLLPSRQHWRPPFIYTTEDIAMLLNAAGGCPINGGSDLGIC